MLVDALAAAPEAGIAGGGLARADGSWEPGAARFPPVRHLLLDTTLGRRRARRRRDPHRVDWVYGTFMAVRADVFATLRGFDTRYFVYGEDMDLCWRAARRGIATLHVPGGARRPRGERERDAALRPRPGSRGREGRDALLRHGGSRGTGALPGGRGVQVRCEGRGRETPRPTTTLRRRTHAWCARAISWRPAWSVPTGAS